MALEHLRALGGEVSPVRTATRSAPGCGPARPPPRAISASGCSRFCAMSTASAFRGETYTTRVSPAMSWPAAARGTARRWPPGTPASVLPEPVGAAMSVSWPSGDRRPADGLGRRRPVREAPREPLRHRGVKSSERRATAGGQGHTAMVLASNACANRVFSPRGDPGVICFSAREESFDPSSAVRLEADAENYPAPGRRRIVSK